MAIEKLPISIQTLYADLVERAWSGSVSELTGRGGSVYTRPAADGRRYLYWQPPTLGGRRPAAEYIGIDNETNRRRIAARQETVAARKERRDMVRSLRAARLPAPDKMTGDVLAALAEAGAFRLRAAVVGSVAFMSYAGLLGVRIPASLARTGDLDIAQFHSVAVAVEDEIGDSFLSLLQRVDKGFTAIASPLDSRRTLRYALRRGEEEVYSVDVLCPLRGPERDRTTYLRALRSHAQTIRYLDYLLYHEVNAAVLHGAGIPVNVPAPERYALHTILVSPMRTSNPRSQAKARKDIDQAAALVLALHELRPDDLADAWRELLDRGPSWRETAARGLKQLPAEPRQILADLVPDRFGAEVLAVKKSGK
jgi:hypothetical protein